MSCWKVFGWAVLALGLAASTAVHARSPEAACAQEFVRDVGPSMQHPESVVHTLSEDCSATAGCDDYFDVTCPAGAEVRFSFCRDGGTADFDTGLASFVGPSLDQLDLCQDDQCGALSEMTVTFADSDPVRIHVGGFNDEAGSYTLSYVQTVGAPGCFVLGGFPVELLTFEIE